MHTTARLATVALVMSGLVLTGCAPDTTGARRVDVEPSPSADATETPEAVEELDTMPPADLTFEAGVELAPGMWTAAWDDRLMAGDARFSVSTPDDGNGSWAYLDQQTQCSVAFYQGAITDLELGADDRESSDNMLAAVLGAQIPGVTGADVSANATDEYVAQTTQEGSVDVRIVVGTGGSAGAEATWSELGRMFGTLGTALVVNVECPQGQDASTEVSDVLNSYLGIAVSSTSE
ncbi:hypothetical protein [Microbacterium sp. NPDC056057]|uniref:hypothetical protein n=1 Tax=Microbacterium sp. NPDC056057 TaxID=3345699 RepID=UPI0035D5BD3B